MPETARFWWPVASTNDAAVVLRRLEAEVAHTDAVGRCGLLRRILPAIDRDRDEIEPPGLSIVSPGVV